MLELVREADTRGLAGSSGYQSLPALLSHLLRIPGPQATQLVEQAWLVIPGGPLTGGATAPTLAHTARALAAGVVGADHVAAIATIMAALPAWLDTQAREDTVPLDVLETELGAALPDAGGFISAAHTRMVACDRKVVPMVLGSRSEPLDIGR